MRRKDGKIDRRSKEYQEAVARMAAARSAMKRKRKPSAAAPATASRPVSPRASKDGGKRRSDGRLDQRTAEGKAMAERMAAMRAKRGKGKKGFFSWLFGG